MKPDLTNYLNWGKVVAMVKEELPKYVRKINE